MTLTSKEAGDRSKKDLLTTEIAYLRSRGHHWLSDDTWRRADSGVERVQA